MFVKLSLRGEYIDECTPEIRSSIGTSNHGKKKPAQGTRDSS